MSKEMLFPLDFAYAYEKPTSEGRFRSEFEDFVVEEDLGFLPSGEGEHLYVHIRKRGENTHWVSEKLASFFKVKNMDVGYCGRKDRNAVSSQWFSVYLPGLNKNIDWSEFLTQYGLNIEVLSSNYHTHKLRRGSHQSNTFTIRLRDVTNIDAAIEKLEVIKKNGVPNYFGEQRFGRESGNLVHASEWVETKQRIKNKNKRSLVMSAARSYLFNLSLSARVELGNWRTLIEGDVAAEKNQVPTGVLWGRGRTGTTRLALEFECAALEPYANWCDHLEHVGLNQERRLFVLRPDDMSWLLQEKDLIVRFSLGTGGYATSLLREVCTLLQHA